VTNSSHHPKKDLALVALENSQNLQNLAGKPDLALGTCLTMANSFIRCDQSWPNFQEFMKEQFSLNLFQHNFAPVPYKFGRKQNSVASEANAVRTPSCIS
jgi:hypothetical protein